MPQYDLYFYICFTYDYVIIDFESGSVVGLDVIPKSYKFSSHANDIHEEQCAPAHCQELVPIVKPLSSPRGAGQWRHLRKMS